MRKMYFSGAGACFLRLLTWGKVAFAKQKSDEGKRMQNAFVIRSDGANKNLQLRQGREPVTLRPAFCDQLLQDLGVCGGGGM